MVHVNSLAPVATSQVALIVRNSSSMENLVLFSFLAKQTQSEQDS
jgi:hypothetical protein